MNSHSSPILLEHNDAISCIRFNRPHVLNAIDSAMAAEFLEACRAIANRQKTRVLLIKGEGRCFMAGLDSQQLIDSPDSFEASVLAPMNEAMQLIGDLEVPVIASVQGPIAGAGLSIALACDLIVAAHNSHFNFAYLPTGSTSCQLGSSWHLPRLVGLHAALEIALLGGSFNAQQALNMGLINRLVPFQQLECESHCLAERLSKSVYPSYGQLKKLLRKSFGRSLEQQLDEEKKTLSACLANPEFRDTIITYLKNGLGATGNSIR